MNLQHEASQRFRSVVVIFSNGTLLDQIEKGELEILQGRLRLLADLFDRIHVICHGFPVALASPDLLTGDRISIHQAPYAGQGAFNKIFFLIYAFLSLVRLQRQERGPLIRVYGIPGMMPVIPLSYVFPSARIVLSYHYHWSIQRFSRYKTMLPLAQKLEGMAFKKARLVIGLTEELKTAVLRAGMPESRIRLIPNWVDTDQFRPGQKGRDVEARYGFHRPYLLYVGRLHTIKNLEMCLRAFARLRNRLDALSLVLVGDGDQKASLMALASRLEIADRVFFTGSLPHKDLPPLYDAAEAFVITSQMEGQPKAVLEAMASGKPIIASEVPGLRELVRNGGNGMLVRYDDIDSLVEAIAVILRDADLRRRLGVASRRMAVEGFSKEVVFAQEKAVYFELASGR